MAYNTGKPCGKCGSDSWDKDQTHLGGSKWKLVWVCACGKTKPRKEPKPMIETRAQIKACESLRAQLIRYAAGRHPGHEIEGKSESTTIQTDGSVAFRITVGKAGDAGTLSLHFARYSLQAMITRDGVIKSTSGHPIQVFGQLLSPAA